MTRSTRSDKDIVKVQKRKPGNVRRREIARVAGELFALQGFSVSTRAIGDALGITQASLYKHFGSKDELIEEVFRTRFLDEKPSDFGARLAASGPPLVERLASAYHSFFDGITEISLKLFQRASYDGLDIAGQYSPHLDARILRPVVAALRAELALPTLDEQAMSRRERELALMLHSTVVFLAMRKFVYGVDFEGSEPELVRLYVATWLDGARVAMGRWHAGDGD